MDGRGEWSIIQPTWRPEREEGWRRHGSYRYQCAAADPAATNAPGRSTALRPSRRPPTREEHRHLRHLRSRVVPAGGVVCRAIEQGEKEGRFSATSRCAPPRGEKKGATAVREWRRAQREVEERLREGREGRLREREGRLREGGERRVD